MGFLLILGPCQCFDHCGQQSEGGDSPPLLRSAETLPEPCVQLWGPQHSTDTDLLERVRRRDREMARGLEPLWWGERLGEVGLLSLGKRRLQGDLIAAFQCLKGADKKDGERLLSRACSDRPRVNGFKLKDGRFKLDLRKKCFMVRVVRHCPRLPEGWSMSHPWRQSRSGWTGL